ncbi:MAG: hypothetical protein SFV52_00580 [Saprospiraceae bacterium]|nr:hypothetical protein [Saprospiraceae bacterium]
MFKLLNQNILLAAGLLLSMVACRETTLRPGGPDVSGVEAPLQLRRFEQDIFTLDTTRLSEEAARLQAAYPELFPLFTQTIIHDVSNPSETPEQALRAFLSSPVARSVYDTVQQVYRDLGPLEPEIKSLLQHYKYYFPEKPVPQVVTLVSEFAVDAFTYGDSLCGIGLDMFLGADYPFYNAEIFPAYIRRQFARPYIPVRLAKALTRNRLGEAGGDRLIDHMVHNGKMLYITSALLPAAPDSLLMGYSREQWEGCLVNEQAVWARLLDLNLLYDTDYNKFRKLVEPSPNAPVLFNEAPGEIGNWMGLQIVRAYMLRYPETSMQALIDLGDARKLLEDARYKPRR